MKSSSTSSQPPPPELVFAFKANWTQARTGKGLRWASRSLPPSNCAPIPSMASGTTPSRPFHDDTVIFLQTLSAFGRLDRTDQDVRVAAFHAWAAFHRTVGGQVFGKTRQQVLA